MARHKGLLKEEFVSKKGEEDVPIDPCKGWVDPCDFCDKRLGNWVESSDEVLEKIPSKPGIFMVALKNKNVTEVQNIVLDISDVQKSAYKCVDEVKDRVADKKAKVTKSTILCRWMNFKNKTDKDVVSLCAHWFNNGSLPKDMKSWPGTDILEHTNTFTFSKKLQKWCHPRKEAVWRKPKTTFTKKVEVVAECDFEEPCELCDTVFGFTSWQSFDDFLLGSSQPMGIYQVSVRYDNKKREIVTIGFDEKLLNCDISAKLRNSKRYLESVYKNEKFINRNPNLEVRWLKLQNVNSENSCFLYAHWLNTRAGLALKTGPGYFVSPAH